MYIIKYKFHDLILLMHFRNYIKVEKGIQNIVTLNHWVL